MCTQILPIGPETGGRMRCVMVGMENGRSDGKIDEMTFSSAEAVENSREGEKRDRFRQRYLASVTLTDEAKNRVAGSLKDIAADSCFVFFKEEDHKDMVIDIHVGVSISVMRGKSSLVLGCSGKIMRVATDGVAIRFDEPLCWWPIFSLFPVNEHFFNDVVRLTS